MKPNDVKNVLRSVIGAKLKCPIIIEGEAGVGKSFIVKQVATELGMGCIDLRLAQMEPGDLIGLPRTDPEAKKTRWLAPEWWPTKETYPGGCILFLDELNRAPVDVRQAIFQVLTDYRMHTHVLPDNVYLVSAINPDEGKTNYQVEQFDPAMVNRMCFLKMETDVDQWVQWAKENDVNDLVTRFIGAHGDMLHQAVETGPFPSPRSWTKLGELISAEAIPREAQVDVISGLVGGKPAVAFIRFMDKNYEKPVSGKEILENFDAHKTRVEKQSNDRTFATTTDVVALIKSSFGKGAKKKLTKTHLDNLTKYALTIKQDEKMALLKKFDNNFLTKIGQKSKELCSAIAQIATEMEKEKKAARV